MGYQLVGIAVIVLFVSIISFPVFTIMKKLHILRADKAIEEIGFDVAELNPGVSEEFIDEVRERIDAKEAHTRKRREFADEEQERKNLVQVQAQ